MTNDEKILREKILRGYAVEAALAYALWLEKQGRLEHARTIIEHALHEGPDFGNHGELSSYGLLVDLEEAWKRVHATMGVTPLRHSTDIYNSGISEPYTAPWKQILAAIAPAD